MLPQNNGSQRRLTHLHFWVTLEKVTVLPKSWPHYSRSFPRHRIDHRHCIPLHTMVDVCVNWNWKEREIQKNTIKRNSRQQNAYIIVFKEICTHTLVCTCKHTCICMYVRTYVFTQS